VELPELAEFDIAIIVMNSMFKKIYFITTHTTITTKNTARLFLYHVWKLYNFPTHIILNRSLQFIVYFTKKTLLKIKIALSIA